MEDEEVTENWEEAADSGTRLSLAHCNGVYDQAQNEPVGHNLKGQMPGVMLGVGYGVKDREASRGM
ncbi:hypothetical protein JZ751_014842 [Albula glossodonta]|uniref:Uncharacterized protein n=1 Tax=Albula glossodonta TaxID=121402 RepID=A0A8T2MYD1_9TELE|nr:hypothetical protein JZ751_014842 [Albula glossodonta]